MKKVKRKFSCRHCGKLFDNYYMTEICFNLDLKILQKDDKLNLSDNELQKQSGTK